MRWFVLNGWRGAVYQSIRVTHYVKESDGVKIRIEHSASRLPGQELQWIQTVTSNNGYGTVCKQMTRVDPFSTDPHWTVSLPSMPGTCKADDLLPFYWTAADLAAGSGPGLSDYPHGPAPVTGRTWNQFTTALAEVTGKAVIHLVYIAWGYDSMADGSIRVAVIRTPSAREISNHLAALQKMYPGYTYT